MSYIVIMAGGSGTRFWPRSRRARPKQFLSFGEGDSLLQRTYKLACKIVRPECVYISTLDIHLKLVKKQIPEVQSDRLILEPVGRDTGPSIALSSLVLSRVKSNAVVAFLPADHYISPERSFAKTIRRAQEVAERTDRILTVGIPPTYPSIGYGYIHFGDAIPNEKARIVLDFTEKPDLKKAKWYLKSGRYYWNSGIFISKVEVLINEILVHAPGIYRNLTRLANAPANNFRRVLRQSYAALPKISIDYAVMEKTDRIATIPATFQWSDLGSWDSIMMLLPKRSAGNYSNGSIITIESHDNIVVNENKLTALIGVNDVVVVEEKDALLICHKDDLQRVKQLVNLLNRRRMKSYL